jgi:tRNA G18 (ribose-2'-O)-methylase SpoU
MASERLIRITDPDDPRIAGYRDIRDRDVRRSADSFIAEGTVVVEMLARAHVEGRGFVANSLLVLENRVAGLRDILDRLPDAVPVYVADKTVMNAIAGFDIHRGVLARGARVLSHDLQGLLGTLPSASLVVAAIGIANHDNVGAIFRNAAAFGADCVLLDETCCDPLYRKALRVSVGTVLAVPFARGGRAEDILTALQGGGFSLWGLSPAGRTDIRGIRPSARAALVTGTEGEGLPAALLESIQTARIAQRPDIDSLNAGTATGIALHAIATAMGRL